MVNGEVWAASCGEKPGTSLAAAPGKENKKAASQGSLFTRSQTLRAACPAGPSCTARSASSPCADGSSCTARSASPSPLGAYGLLTVRHFQRRTGDDGLLGCVQGADQGFLLDSHGALLKFVFDCIPYSQEHIARAMPNLQD